MHSIQRVAYKIARQLGLAGSPPHLDQMKFA